MLKIKDNIDLKELEKWGFEIVNYVNMKIYKYENDYGNIIIGPDYIIHLNHTTVNNISLLDVIYDLIKVDLVEKVEEKK